MSKQASDKLQVPLLTGYQQRCVALQGRLLPLTRKVLEVKAIEV